MIKTGDFMLWGIGENTEKLIHRIEEERSEGSIRCIIDNFRPEFQKQFMGIPVLYPYDVSKKDKTESTLIIDNNYSSDIIREAIAYGFESIYDVRHPDNRIEMSHCDFEYKFIDRSHGRKVLCYILTGYQNEIWDSTLTRIEKYQYPDIDYCLITSGKYDPYIDNMARKNDWSYLYSEKNQVCWIQNLVIDLHPAADYIIKMDEDIFIGKHFFKDMLQGYKKAELTEYRIGFAAPVIPLNCCGYVSYLDSIGRRKEFEEKFGRAYRFRFSAVFNVEETAVWLCDTMESFDKMEDYFHAGMTTDPQIRACFFNVGCIMFSRKRWFLMGKFIENPNGSGMGADEKQICDNNCTNDMPIFEITNALVWHLAFGKQKHVMMDYYYRNKEKFSIQE